MQDERAAPAAMDPEAHAVHAAGIARADHLLEEQRDEVKRMNQMVLKGQCATEREAQVRKRLPNAFGKPAADVCNRGRLCSFAMQLHFFANLAMS